MLTENVHCGVRRIGDCGMPESRDEQRSALSQHRRMEEGKSIFYCYIFFETTLLEGVFTQNPSYCTAILRQSFLKFLSFTSKVDACAAIIL